MTTLDFQEALVQDVKEILKDIVTMNAAGQKVNGVHVYKQQLPIITSDEEDDS